MTSILCPGYRCQVNALLIGVRVRGKITFLPKALPVNSTFVANTASGKKPETRFRFAGKCIEKGCKQWTGSRCGIGDHLVKQSTAAPQSDGIVNCPIRDNCRWFLQSQYDACKICPFIITDIYSSE